MEGSQSSKVGRAGEIRGRVKALLPAIRERALAAEQARSVPRETVEALRETGLYRMVQPSQFGGHECDFELSGRNHHGYGRSMPFDGVGLRTARGASMDGRSVPA